MTMTDVCPLNSNLSDIIRNKIRFMAKNPLDITERASDILRALKKGVLVTAKTGDKVNSTVCKHQILRRRKHR